MNLGPARRAETPSRARAVNQPLVLDSQLEVGTEVGFDSGPPCKKLCFTRETRILATRLSVSGIWVLLYRVDLGCRWVGKLQAEQPAALGHKRDGSRDVLFQGVAGSGLDQGSTPTPLTRSFVSQVKPARSAMPRLQTTAVLAV